LSGTSHCSPCNTLSLPPVSPCNRCRCISQVDQAEEQDGSGFLSFSCSNKLKTNEGCVIDLNSKINRDNFECFGVKFVKIYPEMTSQLKKYGFG
jgi:hypothetical protein